MNICSCLNKKNCKKQQEKIAYGFVDYIVNKLPEIHIPGYQYCGPGTELEKRLARGDPGINKLDQACKRHDIAYSKLQNSKERREADKVLVSQALPRVYSKDARLGERAAALLVSGLMGAKIGLSKIGLGLDATGRKKKRLRKTKKTKPKIKRSKKKSRMKKQSKTIPFKHLVRRANASVKKSKLESSELDDTIKAAIRSVKVVKGNKKVKIPRILKLPKYGGSVLPILPILSALSAIGSISSSAAGVVKTIKNIEKSKQQPMNGATKKIGRGLYLSSTARGSGFYLKPFQQQQQQQPH